VSDLIDGDLVVMDTPNPLYRGIVATVVDLGSEWARGRRDPEVQVAIAARLVRMVAPADYLTYEWVRARYLARVEDLERDGGCDG
jgi:hypothetical protein